MSVNVKIESSTAIGIRCKLSTCGLDAWLIGANFTLNDDTTFLSYSLDTINNDKYVNIIFNHLNILNKYHMIYKYITFSNW